MKQRMSDHDLDLLKTLLNKAHRDTSNLAAVLAKSILPMPVLAFLEKLAEAPLPIPPDGKKPAPNIWDVFEEDPNLFGTLQSYGVFVQVVNQRSAKWFALTEFGLTLLKAR